MTDQKTGTPCWTPYDPDSVIGEFGWLHMPDGVLGPEWQLICTVELAPIEEAERIETAPLYARFIDSGEELHDDELEEADRYRGLPYLSVTEPGIVPGACDQLEIRLRIENGASIATVFGDPETAGRVQQLAITLMREDTLPGGGTECDGVLGEIATERRRQIEAEGWTPAHDDRHIRGELGAAAACYAVPSRDRAIAFEALWPVTWDAAWWKPTGALTDLNARRRDLVKAAALIVAEIERLDRQEARSA